MNSVKRISVGIQLILMFAILANGILFTHSHHTDKGKLITHAHPYSSDSDHPVDPDHSHSAQEFEWIELLNFSPFVWLAFLAVTFRSEKVFQLSETREFIDSVLSQLFEQNSGRAPPLSKTF